MAAPSPSPPPAPPDWSLMLRDILVRIMGSLEMLPDGLSAAAVCRSWRAASAAALGPEILTPKRLLWLLTVPSGGEESSDAELYDIFNGVARRTTLPGLLVSGGWKICGCSHGWLLVKHLNRRMSLVSPFTGAHIPLPICPWRLNPQKAVLSAASSNGCYQVLLIGESVLYSTVSGDDEWQLEHPIAGVPDCIFHCGKLLGVDQRDRILEWVANSEPRTTIQAPWSNDGIIRYFLLAAPWGDLLLVKMVHHFQETERHWVPTEFDVFIVHLTEMTLERTENLHGHTMIIDTMQCSLVSAGCHRELPSDTIIFFCTRLLLWDREMEFPYKRGRRPRFKAGVYNLKSRSFLPLPPSLQPPEDRFMLSMLVISPTLVA